jgi:4,5-dihydroxyphthalate decarboxylase
VPLDKGKKLEDLLVSGEIVAAINVQVDSPDVQPLIANPQEAGLDRLRRDGLYPINHTLVVKDDLLLSKPDLALDIFNVFAEAKRHYVERLTAGQIHEPSKNDQLFRRVMDIIGDPLPYGIAPNRAVLERLIEHSVEQGIISRPFAVEELFAGNTRTLTA